MPPKFRSQAFKFGPEVVVPAHLEPDFFDKGASRDTSKFSLREEALDPDYEKEDIVIAWDIDNANEAQLLAEARCRHISSLGATGILQIHVVEPNGESSLYPPVAQ